MPKRHTNAVFLGELRARTAGKIIHLEHIAEDVAVSLDGARRDLEFRPIGLARGGSTPPASAEMLERRGDVGYIPFDRFRNTEYPRAS